ncbi:mucin-binding protein [Furfurilactobacillus curtus]|uniref:Gram-positive cocci surface proteins LPxTG domain-containing protein n=1 Tax=Furfurilactobacillus curtus TaxID=1746200 RepID=A0ABQ5JQ40_9LACO
MNSETHFKMYKAKKRWLVAGMAAAAFYLAGPTVTQAKADAPEQDQAATSSAATASDQSALIATSNATNSSAMANSNSVNPATISNSSTNDSSVSQSDNAAVVTTSNAIATDQLSDAATMVASSSVDSSSSASGSSQNVSVSSVANATPTRALVTMAPTASDATIGETAALTDITSEFSNQEPEGGQGVGANVLANLTANYQGADFINLTAPQQSAYAQTLSVYAAGIKAAESDLMTSTAAGFAGNYAGVTPTEQSTGLSVEGLTSRFEQVNGNLNQAFTYGYNFAAFGDRYLSSTFGNVDAISPKDLGYYGIALEIRQFLSNLTTNVSYQDGPNLNLNLQNPVAYPMPNGLADRTQLFNKVLAQLTPIYVAGGEDGVRITAENASPVAFADYAAANSTQASVKLLGLDYASGIYTAAQTSFENDRMSIYPIIEADAEADVQAGLTEFSDNSWSDVLIKWAANAANNPLSVTILRTIGSEMVTVGRQVFSDLISTAKTAYSDSTSFNILTNKISIANPYADQNELNTMYQDILAVMLGRIKKVAALTDPTGLTEIQQQAINSVESLSAQQNLGADQLGTGTTYEPNWFPYYKANINSGLATEFAGDLSTLAAIGQNAYTDALGTRPASTPTTTGSQPHTTIGAWDDGVLFAEQQLNPLALDANSALATDPTTYASFADVLAAYKGTDYDYTSVVKAAYNFQRSKLGQLDLNYVRKLDGQSMIIDGKGSVDLWGFVPDTLSVNSDGQSVEFTNGTTQTKTALDLPPVDGVVYTAIPSDADNPAAQLSGNRTATGYYANVKTINSTLWLKAANTLAKVTVLGDLTKGQLTLTVSQITAQPTFATNGTTQTTGSQVFDWTSATLPAGWTFANGNLTYSGEILNPQGTTLNLIDKVGDTLTVTIGFTNTQTAIFNFVDATDNNQSINSLTNVPTDADRTVSGTFNQPVVPTFNNGATLQEIVNQLTALHYHLVTDLTSLPLTYDEDDQTTQSFTIAFVHDQTVVTPDNPSQPGQPIDPANPNGPKWPSGTDLASLQTIGQRTITYVDANTLDPIKVAQTNNGEVVQKVTFDRHAVVDEVTGTILGYDTNGDGAVDVEPDNGNQAWLPKTGTYAAVTSPDLSEYGLINPHDITSPTPTGLPNVPSATAMPNDQLSVTIAYDHQLVPVTPGQHLVPGDPINPDNPNQPVWPAGVADSNLTKTVTRTIHYVDANDPSKSVAPDVISSVSYNRTAVVDAVTGQLLGYAPDPTTGKPTQTASDGGWELASASDTLGAVLSPDLTSQGYSAPDQAIVADQVIMPDYSGADQFAVTVMYAHGTVPVTPTQPGQPGQPLDPQNPDGPKWPTGTAATDLSQISTRTINYFDRQTGAVVAKQVQQQVSYSRTAIVDQVTGALLGYDTVGNGQVTTTDANQAWVLTSPDDTFAAEVSPDLTAAGYLPASLSQVAALKVTPDNGGQSQVVNVYYDHATTPVTPNQPQQPGQPIDPANPDGPKWPAGTDINSLTKTVTRTINYLDQQTNAVVAPAINQAVTLTRTAIVDRATGVLLGYDLDGNGTVDTTDGTAAWQPSGSAVLAAETSPDLTSHGYQPATLKQVPAQTITGDYDGNSNLVVNVYYAHQLQPVTPQQPGVPGQPINPNNPNGPKWPTGTDADSLSQTITRTINYLDKQINAVVSPQVNQAVTLTRTAIVDQVTGNIVGYDTTGDGNANVTDAAQAWVIKGTDQLAAVTSPDLSDLGYQLANPTVVAAQTIATTYTGTPQITVNVYYDHQTTTATPAQPGVPGQPINPDEPNGPKWPVGTDQADLSKTVTRTINYLDR